MSTTKEKTAKKDTQQFYWYDSYTRAMEQLPSATDRAMFAYALVMYGAYSEEIEFVDTKTCPAFAFQAIFEACRINLENSQASRKQRSAAGKASGEARRAKAEARRAAEAEADAELASPEDRAWKNADAHEGADITSALALDDDYNDDIPF